jgi:hypothetical protein
VRSHYLALIHVDVPNLNKRLWKLKVPLKIKIFLWYMRRGVILTKDNLAKRNWQGSVRCCFCHNDETIQHLFFKCPFARAIWSIVQVATNLYLPQSVSNLFGTWLWGLDKEQKLLALTGAAAICWAIWRCRNDIVFDRKIMNDPSQVIYSATHWLRTWNILQKPGVRDTVLASCRRLEQVLQECFSQAHGWRSSLRIDFI